MRVTISEPIRVYGLGFLPLKGCNYEGYHKGWVLVKREYFWGFLAVEVCMGFSPGLPGPLYWEELGSLNLSSKSKSPRQLSCRLPWASRSTTSRTSEGRVQGFRGLRGLQGLGLRV